MMRRILVVFMKFPEAGKVKTRLAAQLGAPEALVAYEEMTAVTLCRLPKQGFETWIAYTPKERQLGMAHWIRQTVPEFQWTRLIPQADGDLGDRLWEVVEAALITERAASVTLIGTDCPWISASHIKEAQRLLESGVDVVFGPAADGGFYLQALKVARREMFFGVPWSAENTLEVCLHHSRFLQLKSALLEPLTDIDTIADWEKWRSENPSR